MFVDVDVGVLVTPCGEGVNVGVIVEVGEGPPSGVKVGVAVSVPS